MTITQPLSGTPVTLYVKDFGAVGDGKTDDAKAILSAVRALRAQAPGSVLEFEAGKTYYYKDNGTEDIHAVIDLKNNKDLTVKGNGCLIMLGGHTNKYADIWFCENCTFEGLNFDFAEYRPAFSAEVVRFDSENRFADLIADRDIHMKDGEIYSHHRFYGTMPTPYSQYYIWVERYEMLDSAKRLFRLHLRKRLPEDHVDWIEKIFTDDSLAKKYGLILPMPRCGFMNEISFNTRFNKDLTFRNINVYTSPYQNFMVTGSTGTFLFENFNWVTAPYDKGPGFTSWGDLYHMTNNRANFIWKNCTIEHPFDDCINIHTNTLFIEKKHSDSEVTLGSLDLWYCIPEIRPGDRLTIVDEATGKKVGKTTVAEVEEHLPVAPVRLSDQEHLRVKFAEPIPGLSEGKNIIVWDEDLASTIEVTDCTMDGSFRVRSGAKFTNCKLHVRRFYIGLMFADFEGPLPQNILFKDCEFTDDDGRVPGDIKPWLIGTRRTMADLVHGTGPETPVENGYHAENIVFENCKGIDFDKIYMEPDDEVVIR